MQTHGELLFVLRENLRVEVDDAAHRLDQLDDLAAARSHRELSVELRGLAAGQERAAGGQLHAVLEAEPVRHERDRPVEIVRHVAELPHVGEQVGQRAYRAGRGEQVGTAVHATSRSLRPALN